MINSQKFLFLTIARDELGEDALYVLRQSLYILYLHIFFPTSCLKFFTPTPK